MGVDLSLMPLLSPRCWAAHTQIDLGRNRELWEKLMHLPVKEIPEPISCYRAHDGQNTIYGEVDKSPYGERLTYTTAEELLKFKDCEEVKDDWENRAAWAYLAQMPADWPIVLYWH